jgi:hypothetical protein
MIAGMAFVFGGPVAGWILHTLIVSWRQVRTSEHLAVLKQNMLDRGMSADDIERVINAGLPANERPAPSSCRGKSHEWQSVS